MLKRSLVRRPGKLEVGDTATERLHKVSICLPKPSVIALHPERFTTVEASCLLAHHSN